MEFSIDPGVVVAFIMLTTRVVTIMVVAPPFSGSVMPNRVRIAVAAAIGLAMAPSSATASAGVLPTDVIGLVWATGFQVVAGILLGLTIQLLFSAVASAGAIIDMSAGLSAGALYDPSMQGAATPVSRLYQTVAIVTLFVIDGHILLLKGVIRSYEAAPLHGLRLDELDRLVVHGAGQFFLAALEIAFPLLVAMVLTEVIMGLASRAAPKLNVLITGFAVKTMVLIFLLGLTMPLVLAGADRAFTQGLRLGSRLIGG